jgi:4a-hydroxytetrahydrobiopterin dehydratase
MDNLAHLSCTPCRAGDAAVSATECAAFLKQLPGWQVLETPAGQRLQRVFPFADFAAALAFTNKVGALAEAAQHHPALSTEWGRVTVTWWTHAIDGLHRNDFIMAKHTDLLTS